MASLFEALQVFVLVVVCCFGTSSANPITVLPTTIIGTTTQSTSEYYAELIVEVERFGLQFKPNLTLFKTVRMQQADALAPDMDIRGFLTVKNDLPSTHERRLMSESELLPKHKLFLQTYVEVMKSLKDEETLALATHPESYTTNFCYSYDLTLMHIERILHKVSTLMTLQGIADGPAQTFEDFQYVPHNYQVHNTRSLFVLQSISYYIDASSMDYSVLHAKSES